MKSIALVVMIVGLWCAAVGRAAAQTQDPPVRIGPYVFDLRGIVPRFGDSPELADSRGLSQAEMPGTGLGLTAGAHIYLPKVLGITVGLGGEATIGHSHGSPPAGATTTATGPSGAALTTALRPVNETFKSLAPQLSLNFAGRSGWSYVSGGVGRSTYSIVPDGGVRRPLDDKQYSTINYGGGARWFIKPHLAFSLDVRFYQLAVGLPVGEFSGSPRTVLLVIGAGIAVR